ncbi:MAG: glycosyltransferase family 4 protein [Lachnospiraceae bacterium]|nr:glycosyltransferase family 4 protein [Lachnospiraceae bacterium]
MRVLLFGTGDYYNKYKQWFRGNSIVALVDNDADKQGTRLDGYLVIAPQDISKYDYDLIFVLSVHEKPIRKQLAELGVKNKKICMYSELYKYPEMLVRNREVFCYGMLPDEMCKGEEKILLMSHNLDYNGAALALFYAAKILKKHGYSVVFASWSDGELKEDLLKEGIPVVVDANLQIQVFADVEWIKNYPYVFCNTLNYYLLLLKRHEGQNYIWWLHDPEMFYENMDKEILRSVDGEKLECYAVGPISERAFRTYLPQLSVSQLIYGIPDMIEGEHKSIEASCKMGFITIGNVQDYKGQDILIKAIKKMPQTYLEQAHFRIVGGKDSAYMRMVKKMAEGLEESVEFVPPVRRVVVHRLLEEADVLVCPSRVDTMSIVANEAMMHSIPCIVSDSAGVAAYVDNGINGFVYESENVEELCEKICQCIERKNELKEIGKASRNLYEKYFSMPVFEGNLLEVIHHQEKGKK